MAKYGTFKYGKGRLYGWLIEGVIKFVHLIDWLLFSRKPDTLKMTAIADSMVLSELVDTIRFKQIDDTLEFKEVY